MLGDFVKKLEDAQRGAKERLESILVDGQSAGGEVKVVANGNKEIKQVFITEDFYKDCDKEELEDLLLVATNRAIAKAEDIHNSEMKGMAQGVMPGGLPDMFK